MTPKIENLAGMLDLLRRLVECESPSHDKAGVDGVVAILSAELTKLGADLQVIPNQHTGDLLIARFNPQQPADQKGFLLLGHMDTVFPRGTLASMPYLESGERILGPGVSDMKAGLVIGLAALRRLQEQGNMPDSPVTFLFTSDEESGSQTSRPWIEKLAQEACLVLVLEPGLPDGAIKTWRKGVGEFHIVAHGKAAHSGGEHEKGCNAIQELAHQVLRLQALTDYARGTTLNVGLIQGGMAVNVVPDIAWLDVDLRVMQPGEAERITEIVMNLQPVLQGTRLEVTGGLNRPPMPYDERMQATFEHAWQLAAGHGIPLTGSGTGGASDANFVAPLGIPVLDGLGAIGGGYHSPNEFILKDSLVSRVDLLAALLQDW